MDGFRVRLNCIDHYQAVPHDEFDPPVPLAAAALSKKERPRVSVLRVFGATETGQRVLMHIHGAFQYTYLEYAGSLLPHDVDVAIQNLHLSIDHALAVSYRKNIYEGTHRYVAHISLVKGVPFYGYHVGYKFYLKIYLLNPLHMNRMADLMREGAIMKRVLQPYESHMQYIAQWMCDYNLYGCGYIDCGKVKFRSPVPNYHEIDGDLHQWHNQSILPENISDETVLPKQSHCALEVDLRVEDILNRHDVEHRPLHYDFIERLKPIPLDAKLVQSMKGLWQDETRRRKARMGLKDPNSTPFPPEVLVTMSADPRNVSSGGWIHEQELRQKIDQLAADERSKSENADLKFESYVKPVALEAQVQTALDSVEDLYSHNMKRHNDVATLQTRDSIGEVVVDEQLIHGVNGHQRSSEEERPPDERADEQSAHSSEHDNANNGTEVLISSSEYEKYGVHRAGADFDPTADDFEIPDEFAPDSRKGTTKRIRFAPARRSRKRRKLLTDEIEALSDLPAEDSDNFNDSGIEDEPADHEEKADAGDTLSDILLKQTQRPAASSAVRQDIPRPSQNSTLKFPVVKDPQNPDTISRLSQASGRSQPSTQKSLVKTDDQPSAYSKAMAVSSPSMATKTLTSPASGKSSAPSSLQRVRLPGLQAHGSQSTVLVLQTRPPTSQVVATTISSTGLPDQIYQEAFYSDEADVPDQAREYAGREFKLESGTIPYLPEFDPTGMSAATKGEKPAIVVDRVAEDIADNQRRKRCTHTSWAIADPPPRPAGVLVWLDAQATARDTLLQETKAGQSNSPRAVRSQIEAPTPKNKHGFKYSGKQASSSVQHATQYMSTMALEVHVNTRGKLAPSPEHDEVACIFWCVQNDDAEDFESNVLDKANLRMGLLALAEDERGAAQFRRSATSLGEVDVDTEDTELDMFTRLVDIVRAYDPDILTGYEVHNSSWGYLIERARVKYDMNLCDEISRMKSQSHGRFGKDEDRWGFNHASTIRVTGRHTINVWRAMKGELNLLQYTLENVTFHLLQKRVPHYHFKDLTSWYRSKVPRERARVLEYFCERVRIDLEILDANELVARTSEQARLIGVDWYSVISRGSQFKVENIMFRIAKPENLLLPSPSRRQVGGQNALECLPLVMEPMSDFYTSPLLVLDFQSLYPSCMIAYNYCYSTFLGRVVSWRGTNKMGFSNYQRQEGLLGLLKDYVNIAPNGIMYVKKEIRKSLLAKMLSELLETRVMVKSGMKVDKDDKTLQRLLNNRQLALKLIANVTYGYTSAIQTGRETLEKAIALIHNTEKWGAEVVYGDTDSLFVYLKGRTRAQAFDIGEDIADTITKLNPRPVKLKFEKVYHPCVLLAKKRYVGFKYESRSQTEPDFDAKGIETVRRDGTPAQQKIEEMALKVLFRTADLSKVKSFFQAQCAKIMRGKVSIQDFVFAKEVKLGTYSDKGPPPPGALISARRMVEDARLEPQYGERVPYVVVTGGPGARLIDRCVDLDVLLHDAQSELDADYYITKNLIPPLERIFNLVGANVMQWYDEMPKYQRIRRIEAGVASDGREVNAAKKTLEAYMKSSTCLVCKDSLDTGSPICSSCLDQAPHSLLLLKAKLARAQQRSAGLLKVCRSCSGLSWNESVRCDSKDCPVFYTRTRTRAALTNDEAVFGPIVSLLEEKQNESIDW
ncbi:DNA polymerase zeta catalytic subunit [Cyphellophora attinorum]|uniref:DNA polymerase n=1 Tax=Cyphellophora attinorum TaxID=1664694 RepID=A0A0N1H8H9_9EURO|nr:DNA polymerase zeta catalytic subunit [Phialophora attinorum]KPI43322.1 DNA polymerase zeta catalytic subunit [Phialophora attinorum]